MDSVSLDEWRKQVSEVEVRREDINKLVMNYLVVEGFKDAAEAFMTESGEQPPVDLAAVESRMKVRAAVQNGQVQSAVELVNDLNPEILDTNPRLYFHLCLQQLIEEIRAGNTEKALAFAKDELAPLAEEHEAFMDELEETMALFALQGLQDSPVSRLLSPMQRQTTASELNAAILASQAQDQDAKLPSLLRILHWSQDNLRKALDFPRMNDLGKFQTEENVTAAANGDDVVPMDVLPV